MKKMTTKNATGTVRSLIGIFFIILSVVIIFLQATDLSKPLWGFFLQFDSEYIASVGLALAYMRIGFGPLFFIWGLYLLGIIE